MSQSITQAVSGPVDQDTATAAPQAGAKNTYKRNLGPLYIKRALVLIVFLCIWEASVRTGFAEAAFISSPLAVSASFLNLAFDASFWPHLYTSLIEVAVAFVLSVVLGVLAAIFLDRNESVNDVISPYIAAFNSMPRIALGPIFILWFGIGISSKIVLATSLGFFIILMNTYAGLRNVDRDMLLMSRLYGASETRLFWYVRLPWALPSIFAGLKLTLIYCMSGAIIGEMIAARSGLGLLLQTYSGQFDIASVLAVMLMLVLVVVILTAVIDAVERRLLGWSHGSTNLPE